MNEMITQKCNKCKKELSIHVFGVNWNGVFFKHCDNCRQRGRLEQARAALRKKGAISNSTPTREIIEKVDIVKDDKDNDQLEDSAMLSKSNKNQFVQNLITLQNTLIHKLSHTRPICELCLRGARLSMRLPRVSAPHLTPIRTHYHSAAQVAPWLRDGAMIPWARIPLQCLA